MSTAMSPAASDGSYANSLRADGSLGTQAGTGMPGTAMSPAASDGSFANSLRVQMVQNSSNTSNPRLSTVDQVALGQGDPDALGQGDPDVPVDPTLFNAASKMECACGEPRVVKRTHCQSCMRAILAIKRHHKTEWEAFKKENSSPTKLLKAFKHYQERSGTQNKRFRFNWQEYSGVESGASRVTVPPTPTPDDWHERNGPFGTHL